MPIVQGYITVTMQYSKERVAASESHVYYRPNIALSDATLIADAAEIAVQRTRCMGGDVSFIQVKFSVEGINRDVGYLPAAQLPIVNANGQYDLGPYFPGTNGAGIQSAAYQTPQVSWPLKLNDANQNQLAIVYIMGMPASIGQFGPGPTQVKSIGMNSFFTPNIFLSGYGNYLIGLSSSPRVQKWGVASRTWPSGVFNAGNSTAMTAVPLVAVGAAGTPTTIAFTIPALGFKYATAPDGTSAVQIPKPGDFIRVGGLKWTPKLTRQRFNGTYQVVQYQSTTNTVICNVPRLQYAPIFLTTGYIQGSGYFFQPYQAFTVDNITHRKRGVTTDAPRGRRSAA